MSQRANRRRRTRESGAAQRRRLSNRSRLTSRLTWGAGLAAIILILVAGGIFFAKPQGSEQDLLLSSTTREVGKDFGDLVPDFDIRLVNGNAINSAELVSAKKPVFYFFFATW